LQGAASYAIVRSRSAYPTDEADTHRMLRVDKASRYLTHIRRLSDIEDGVKRFHEPLAPLTEAGRLAQWARRIAQWRRTHEVYAYFNND
jgi:uncharacterized protein YecE (DUF72 family)